MDGDDDCCSVVNCMFECCATHFSEEQTDTMCECCMSSLEVCCQTRSSIRCVISLVSIFITAVVITLCVVYLVDWGDGGDDWTTQMPVTTSTPGQIESLIEGSRFNS